MTTVAVIGAAQPVGQALLERLDADPRVERILGIDCDEPAMPVAKLEFRTGEVRDQLLALALEGADVVVHAGLDEHPDTGEDERFARNVHGTRNVLDAVAKTAPVRYVHLSSAAVYGAHSDNALPLRESSPLRANPDHATAYHQLLAEELVEGFAQSHPATRVVVLRPATVLGHGVDHVLARHLLAPRLLTVADSEPPLQFLHLDDLAAALHLAVLDDLTGAYNVAADGWLAADELSTVLGRRRLAVPEAVAFGLARGMFSRHLASTPPGALHYLMHPTVVTSARMKAAGWSPSRSNREILREFAADHHGELRLGRLELRTRDVVLGGATVLGGLTALVARAIWQRRPSRHRRG
jgi:nucleoside-diphosphate-sugar epimerase